LDAINRLKVLKFIYEYFFKIFGQFYVGYLKIYILLYGVADSFMPFM